MMNWGNYGWGMGFGWIFMIIFWVLMILGIVFIVQTTIKGKKYRTERSASRYFEEEIRPRRDHERGN